MASLVERVAVVENVQERHSTDIRWLKRVMYVGVGVLIGVAPETVQRIVSAAGA